MWDSATIHKSSISWAIIHEWVVCSQVEPHVGHFHGQLFTSGSGGGSWVDRLFTNGSFVVTSGYFDVHKWGVPLFTVGNGLFTSGTFHSQLHFIENHSQVRCSKCMGHFLVDYWTVTVHCQGSI